MTNCPACNGEGRFPIGENYVSHDMAMDAGEPSMEGQSMGVEYVACALCEGQGKVPDSMISMIDQIKKLEDDNRTLIDEGCGSRGSHGRFQD